MLPEKAKVPIIASLGWGLASLYFLSGCIYGIFTLLHPLLSRHHGNFLSALGILLTTIVTGLCFFWTFDRLRNLIKTGQKLGAQEKYNRFCRILCISYFIFIFVGWILIAFLKFALV